MLQAPRIRGWQILWWTAVLLAALRLKHHYSVATAEELEWLFRPLAMLLEWFTGFGFHRDSHFEWVSEAADIRLVKACAGINFMIMSFLAYAWTFAPDARRPNEGRAPGVRPEASQSDAYRPEACRPASRRKVGLVSEAVGQLLMLGTALVAAWATSLAANSIRIVLAMTAGDQGWEAWIPGLDEHQLHRLIGMLVYVPLLSLQVLLGDRLTKTPGNAALVAPVLLYVLLTVLVPLLTGNAWQNPAAFIEHLGYVTGMSVILGTLLVFNQHRKKQNGASPCRKAGGNPSLHGQV